MGLVRAAIQIDASPQIVWDLLLDWEGSSEWMVDATVVEVVGSRREGVGTHIRAVTRIAGVALTDEMVVTRWEEGRLIQVEHLRAPVRGMGWFEVRPHGEGTFFEWAEELDPPLGPLGELGLLVLKGQIDRILGKSLTSFRGIAEGRARGGRNP